MNETRLARLVEEILAHGLDGLALMPGPNMVYVSGIHAHIMERPTLLFIPADDPPAIIMPTLEAMKAEAAGIEADRIFAYTDEEGYTGAFQQACAHLELSDYLLGVEAFTMRVVEYEMLKRYAPGLQTTHAEDVLMALRGIKDREELSAMHRAVKVAEAAIKAILPTIAAGQTEKAIASRLQQALYDAGADDLPFSPIVAAGPNGALPHATPTTRPLAAGDLLIIDWGAMVDGYVSDMTRTYAIGAVEDEFVAIHKAVQAANAAGRAASKPGTTPSAVDAATRAVIVDAGYGEYFIHRTGHGLGMEGHEPPSIVGGNEIELKVGMTYTVEPGIYLPGRAGVRIEDDVVITPDGHRSLTSLPRELQYIG